LTKNLKKEKFSKSYQKVVKKMSKSFQSNSQAFLDFCTLAANEIE
jgi:hypothetical protein